MSTKLLVVDDSIFVYEELKYMLADTDFTISGYAKNGQHAIKLYEEIKPDIVLLDIIMSGMDGIETASSILSKWPDAKIIIMSSLAYEETLKEIRQVGALDFIAKPADRSHVIEILAKYV